MTNANTGQRIKVHTELGHHPFLAVPRKQVQAVQDVLVANGIGYSVGSTMPINGEQEEDRVIQIGTMIEVQRVQRILDAVP